MQVNGLCAVLRKALERCTERLLYCGSLQVGRVAQFLHSPSMKNVKIHVGQVVLSDAGTCSEELKHGSILFIRADIKAVESYGAAGFIEVVTTAGN